MSKISDKHMAMINYHVSKYSGSDVPASVLMAKAKLIYAETMRSYDPSKGDLDSYLNMNLMGLNRFVGGSMQIRMPEHKQQKLRSVMDSIYNEYGDDDNIDFKHMSTILHMTPKAIKSIYAGGRRSIVADSSVEDFTAVSGSGQMGAHEGERLYQALPTQMHKDIYDYAMGEHGKELLKTNAQIAMRLGISETYVRKLKEDILAKVKTC